jgi:S1-C subfamily serine protease
VGRHLAQSPHTWLQISARANYGSLGGVLVDGRGEILGMSVLLNPNENWLINSGVAMAIGGAEVSEALVALKNGVATDQLPTMGLGVALSPDAEGRPHVGQVIPGTGAAAAGLQAGDILVKVDGVIATSHMAIARALNRHHPGDKVTVEYLRDGKNATCQVELSEFKGPP